MNTPEQEVTCFELARELKEVGYPQKGLWCWVKGGINNVPLITHNAIQKGVYPCNIISAPTVAELGERLPSMITGKSGTRYKLLIGRNQLDTGWIIDYTPIYSAVYPLQRIIATTEANARAKMWLYLRKNKLI